MFASYNLGVKFRDPKMIIQKIKKLNFIFTNDNRYKTKCYYKYSAYEKSRDKSIPQAK